jgi:hypothetical protein
MTAALRIYRTHRPSLVSAPVAPMDGSFRAMPSARATHEPSRLRRLGLSVGIAIALAGCDSTPPKTAEPGVGSKLEGGDVALFAVAPDGTRLWAVEGESGRTVYFSGSGATTSHSEYCGKGCTRTIDDIVPSGAPHD